MTAGGAPPASRALQTSAPAPPLCKPPPTPPHTFGSEVRELLELLLQKEDGDPLCGIHRIVKAARSEPRLITHLFQTVALNTPLSALNPQNICTLAARFVSAKQ